MSTNFDLAPPSKVVDGLLAVPIDIQSITAALTFDGATQTATGDATVAFTTGPQAGNPIFDLRQTITAAWLDGAPFPVAQLAHHDFGGGPDSQLRVVESVLPAGTTHTLRVTYTLGLPQASTAGSYQPGLSWAAGPRLTFNFGFTDLGAGRYLEAWIPANLIFDQFDLALDIQVAGTPVAHQVITNGTVTSLGANHWSVVFPGRFTACSPLLEVRAADRVTGLSGTVALPVSGTTVTIETWKPSTGTANLATALANLQSFLPANELANGAYLHGNRFVALLHQGGMEYEGGTTTSPSPLRHETFHSWWARGLKPASQPDGWWDEAWTVYNDNGASSTFPFDFAEPAVELCPRQPWVRITAPGSYTAGERFFEGVAALTSAPTLRTLMSEYYGARNARPATTADLEAFLVARSGQPQLVDGFHRFVYGLPDPGSAPDLWLRDDPAHTGADAWPGAFWDSPDVWIRNQDDGGTAHQNPEFGQDNWFHARVRNRSAAITARHFVVTFNVKSFAGTQFAYPADFLPCVAAAAGFDLGPGGSVVVKARWPAALVPPEGTHTCALAAVITRLDHPQPGLHVWEHNNLAQKNLTVVDLSPGDWIVVPFRLRNHAAKERRILLEVVRPRPHPRLVAALLLRKPETPPRREVAADDQAPGAHVDCGSGRLADPPPKPAMWTSLTPHAPAARFFAGAKALPFAEGPTQRLDWPLAAGGQAVAGLRVEVPREARPGEELYLHLVQRGTDGRIEGGIALRIRVR